MNTGRLLALIVLLSASSRGLPGDALVGRIEQKNESLDELEGLYEARTDPAERAAILESTIENATWLEQAAGMKSARTDLLLALARWELLRLDGPPSFGLLCDPDGLARPSVLARRPRKDELPGGLSRFSERLLFIHIHNESQQPVFLTRPSLELPGGVGEPKVDDIHPTTDWPQDLQALAKWGRWPEQVEATGKAVCLIWLAPDQNGVLYLNVPVRWQEDEPPRVLRVAFLKELEPEALARARQEAIRREAQLEKKLVELTNGADSKKPPVAAVKSEDPPAPPAEVIPPAVGRVDPAGDGEVIQLRLDSPDTYGPNKKLRVRKNDRWVGVVVLHETDRSPNKQVYWATIVEGRRKDLYRGALHEMK